MSEELYLGRTPTMIKVDHQWAKFIVSKNVDTENMSSPLLIPCVEGL